MPTETRCRDEWLLRVLEEKGAVAAETARELRRLDWASPALLGRGLLSEQALAETLWGHYRLLFKSPSESEVERVAVGLVPEGLCRRRNLIPLRLDGDAIEVLSAEPLDASALDEVRAASGREPCPVFALPGHIAKLLDQVFDTETAICDLLNKLEGSAPVECLSLAENAEASDDRPERIGTPVITLANRLIAQAVRQRASDIHIEQEEHSTVVRYRIDGILRTVITIPKHIGNGPLISRIKIMANLDLADRRRAQDGRAMLRVGIQDLGLRVSTIPTAFGEKAVLRLLDSRQAQVSLGSLGFRPEIRDQVAAISESNQGLLLVTGPTGSGKTTTLYALLNRLKSDGVNIVTVEDPIEYRLPGINQVQVHEKAGLGFAAILRSVLRQDPDIILVGEIRDRETADIAFQAALTGHMVLSTLHTNDALSTINRLLDMGVERFKLAPSLVGVVSQRLIRRTCPDCLGAGCATCGGTGLHGRIALAEVLDLRDPEARQRLGASASLESFEAAALEKGWLRRISDDAHWHLHAGESTRAELAPYLNTSGPELPKTPASPVAAAAATPAGRRVLVVDDCPDNRALARDTLMMDGYTLCEAPDGETALAAMKTSAPDLVLLDLMMPGLDGFAVIKRMRQDPALARLPVIVLTALGELESQTLSLELGADDYMTKPFHPKVLRARVQALFRRRSY